MYTGFGHPDEDGYYLYEKNIDKTELIRKKVNQMYLAEEVVQFKVDTIYDEGKILHAFNKIKVVNINDQHLAFLVVANPIFVMPIQVFQIIQANRIFEISSTLLDLTNKFGDICF